MSLSNEVMMKAGDVTGPGLAPHVIEKWAKRIAELEAENERLRATNMEYARAIERATVQGMERAVEIVLARVKDGEGDHIFQIRNANLTTAADAIRAEIDK